MDSFFCQSDINDKRNLHEEDIKTSQPYNQTKNHTNNLIADFKKGLVVTGLAATREYSYKESALLFGLADLISSVTAIELILSDGLILNASKRELRYMLEATIKYSAIDQKCKSFLLEDKLNYLYSKIPRSSIDPIDDINDLPKTMVTDTRELHSLLSQFIHPSQKQITEYKMQFEKGKLGFETHKEIDSLNRLFFRTFDTILYLTLKTLGYYITQDVFYILSEDDKWKFHKGKHIKTLPNKYSKHVR